MGLLDFTEEFEETLARWDGTIGAPSAENRKKSGIAVFKSRFVETVFATSHPIMPGVWFGGFIGYGLFLALTWGRGAALGLALYLAGVLAFTLLEYCLHRWAFHWDPGDDPKRRLRLFLMHGYHHQFPNDKWRLVAPPLMSWPIAIVVFAVYWALLPLDVVWVLFGGTTLGYVLYDWAHYYTHHFRNPRFFLGKVIRRAHAVHHYKLFHLNMGISSPLWDLVFGTFGWSDATIREAMAETRRVEAEQEEKPSDGRHPAV